MWPSRSSLLLCLAGLALGLQPSLASDPCEKVWQLQASTSEAAHVVLATVIDLSCIGDDEESIHTVVQLDPIQVLKGELMPGSPITVQYWGGKYPNGHWASDPYLPWFNRGDTALVLLAPKGDLEYFRVMHGASGQYDVLNGRFSTGELAGLSLSDGLLCLATVIEARSPQHLADEADVVCIADFASREVVINDAGKESTITTLRVVDVLKGDLSRRDISIYQLGDVTQRVTWPYDQPVLAKNKRYFLFLRQDSDGIYRIVGGLEGCYRIEGETVAGRDFSLQELLGRISGH